MNNWKKIAELRQERIEQLKLEKEEIREKYNKMTYTAEEWRSLADEWRQNYYLLKGDE